MPRRLLSFDFDGVIGRPPFGINPGTGTNKQRGAPGKLGPLWLTERWRYGRRRAMPGAVEGLTRLSTSHDIVVVTARAEKSRGLTERWLAANLGFVPPVLMRPTWRETSAAFKARVIGSLGPAVHFEDDPFTADWIADLNVPVALIDWPRNRGLSRAGVVRVSSIAEGADRLEDFIAP